MLLNSSVDPGGPKSSKHYLVLHCNNRRNLVTLPKSYLDLENLVERLYRIELGHFYVETQELNLCKGERVIIPEDAWDDIAHLLGNLHVVPERDDGVSRDNPEAGQGADIQPTSGQNVNEGQISLKNPLVADEVLLIKIGQHVGTKTECSPSTEYGFQLVDKDKIPVISLDLFPQLGRIDSSHSTSSSNVTTTHTTQPITVKADHYILVRKEGDHLLVLFDFQIVAAIEAPSHSPIAAVAYNLGAGSLLNCRVLARTYTSFTKFTESFGQRLVGTALDKDVLYAQILRPDPRNAGDISRNLETIRKEINSHKHSSSGTKWRGHAIICEKWTNFNVEWGVRPHSVFVLNYNLNVSEHMTPDSISITFGPRRGFSLRVTMGPDKEVEFGEHSDEGYWKDYHRIEIDSDGAMQTPGAHSVALVNHDGEIHVIFDFRWSTVLPKTTLMTRRPSEIRFNVPLDEGECTAQVDVYEFGRQY